MKLKVYIILILGTFYLSLVLYIFFMWNLERNSKRSIKVSFGCEDQGRHCLHDENLFNIHTQYPHLWIHIIFLDIQSNARLTALNANERSISDLKECWDELKHTNISFRELTQSEFPNDDDLKKILNELCYFGYFDLFDHCILNKTGIKWCCILCNRPKHVAKFIQNSIPLIEDELLEKNGHWVSLKQWKIQNFILYTTRLSCKIAVSSYLYILIWTMLKSTSVKSLVLIEYVVNLPAVYLWNNIFYYIHLNILNLVFLL